MAAEPPIRSDNSAPEPANESCEDGSSHQEIHWVRLIDGKSDFSPHFLEDFAIAVENPRERSLADICTPPRIDFRDGSLSRNKLHVMCAVIMILQKGRQGIRKHDRNLPKSPQNSRQIDGLRYRNQQLRILDGVLDIFCAQLRAITGLDSSQRRDFRIVRLEHTLTESPDRLNKDMRGVLNAGLKTREPGKIRERGGSDFAFTVWLCGLWILNLSGQQEDDPIDQICPQYRQWLGFLSEHYKEEPQNPTDQHSPDHTPSSENELESAMWFDPLRNNISDDDPEADLATITASYLDAILVATAKRPQSLFNDPRVTANRLVYCLKIIRNEGVWCPSVEKGREEEDDEWILFLETGNANGS